MDKTRFALIIVASMVAAAGGALYVSHQLHGANPPKDPIDEAQDMIGDCYRKINEIQAKLGGARPSTASAGG